VGWVVLACGVGAGMCGGWWVLACGAGVFFLLLFFLFFLLLILICCLSVVYIFNLRKNRPLHLAISFHEWCGLPGRGACALPSAYPGRAHGSSIPHLIRPSHPPGDNIRHETGTAAAKTALAPASPQHTPPPTSKRQRPHTSPISAPSSSHPPLARTQKGNNPSRQ
jgi:hypothetical protein